jgi:site-specific DNA-methyltransferase (adenine-specific)
MKPYYEQDGITIYHGDCREVMGGFWGDHATVRPFSLLLTDPPYGISFAAQPTKWQRRAGKQAEAWDDATADEGVALARRICLHQIIWGGNYYDLPPARCLLSWYKPDAPPSMGNVEYAWTNLWQNSRQISVSISATNRERVGHPTQKPEAVMVWALQQSPVDASSVFDPFMGSGTTLVAAKRLGRKATGVEISEKYCEIAAKRLAQGALPMEFSA